jgi:hypothetical protein
MSRQSRCNYLPPVELYDHILTVVATTDRDRRFHTVVDAVLKHVLSYLNNDTAGLRLRILQCLAPAENASVICLYVRMAVETAPWTPGSSLELHGAESLAGYAANKRITAVSQNVSANPEHLPLRLEEHTNSVAVFPFLQEGRVAGCFQISSTQPAYFSPSCLDGLCAYTRLLTLAFPPSAFCDQQALRLHVMPDNDVQRTHFASLRQRIATQMRSSSDQTQATVLQAELKAIQELAQELATL